MAAGLAIAMPMVMKMQGGSDAMKLIPLWWLADAVAYLLLLLNFRAGFFWIVFSLLVTVGLSIFRDNYLFTTAFSALAVSTIAYAFYKDRPYWRVLR
ncbi:hypothetical protein FNU76_14760 [Chitinimonas arctica]|uniref:Uncharacterized protein n=1 Tax=Chitinimonas arctica TaxID=2594795 RepID=A0A516SH98_9NEIS|nr:hypothetical protein [Chitinimonas arctica]QDQ27515.1 hypothetical protein FNU76_14760 [Chitinimonas arctica]